jgi:serine/tyrosine/threonine adenylyltransferase
LQFQFDNSYEQDLGGLYLKVSPTRVSAPKLIRFNYDVAKELRLDVERLNTSELANLFSGNKIPDGAQPLAMAYAGHQFGHFSPQLGDGRAILLGEVIDRLGNRHDIQLKGCGRTPFSRGGDGRSALGPVLREYIVSEAMHALGIPATRALAAVRTGEDVHREMPVPGGVFTRVAASHIRVGTFQFFAARGDFSSVKRLTEYAVKRHYPEAAQAQKPALAFLEMVAHRQAALIAKWLSVGFVHGVMNTDNCAISGQTIDFGPCAFMDHYDRHALFSSIDKDGRYASSNQASIIQWNLARLAETLVPLIDPDQDKAVVFANDVLSAFPAKFERFRMEEMGRKLGFISVQQGDAQLLTGLLDRMQLETIDYTIAFRALSLPDESKQQFAGLFNARDLISIWIADWQKRLKTENRDVAAVAASMLAVNPKYIARNHRVEEVIRAAVDHNDFAPFHRLVDVLARPFDDQPENSQYSNPPLENERVTKTFCGT